MSEDVRLVNDAHALLSMRDSDFDAYSAYGEVVDNSIQANANQVKIRLKSTPSTNSRSNHEYVQWIAFGDNGDGMDAGVLRHCLQLGYSTRYNDRSGIGRFGVGATLAAINQCKRVDVYSKISSGDWLWTYFDIDEITAEPPTFTSIPIPTNKAIPKDMEDLVGGGSGTLVVWSKYDRQPASAPKIVKEMHVWMGRTYRRFMRNGCSLEINSETVYVIDPLYTDWRNTRFPNDPPGESFPPISILWPVPAELQDAVENNESEIVIQLSLVDESLRPTMGSGATRDALDRHINRNQGVSIMRNNREVLYGPIPYWPGPSARSFVEIDRWWSCEISFDAILDRAFTVKNIKRGAVPGTELKKAIYDAISPTVETCLDTVREVWAQAKKKKEQEAKEKGGPKTGHEDAENTAKKTPTDKSAIDKDKDVDAEAQVLVDQLRKGDTEEQKALWIAKWKDQPFTIHDDTWRGPDFFEAVHLGGSDVIRYNQQHPFFEQVTTIINTLDLSDSDTEEARKLKNLLDLLIISYSKAEAKFERDLQISVEDFVDQMRMSWGQYLVNYLRTWLKERDA